MDVEANKKKGTWGREANKEKKKKKEYLNVEALDEDGLLVFLVAVFSDFVCLPLGRLELRDQGLV